MEASGAASAGGTRRRLRGVDDDSSGGAGRGGPRQAKVYRKGPEQDPFWHIYHDRAIMANPGWEDAPQPWTPKTALKYLLWCHVDRLWPEVHHERNCKHKDAKWTMLEDKEVKWRFHTILRAISDNEHYTKQSIPFSIVGLMYAEHVLGVQVDWSTLPKGLSQSYLLRRPMQIPYVPMPDWFRVNPKLYDDPAVETVYGRARRRGGRHLPEDVNMDEDEVEREITAAMELEENPGLGAVVGMDIAMVDVVAGDNRAADRSQADGVEADGVDGRGRWKSWWGLKTPLQTDFGRWHF